MALQIDDGNDVFVGENVVLSGNITGRGNKVYFEGAHQASAVTLSVNGDNNVVHIGKLVVARQLSISCGNHVPAHNTALCVGPRLSVERNGRFYLYTSGNALTIGTDCMFANDVTVRCGESPHLLFDLETAEFLDKSSGVIIGDHVWLGERAYLMKSASIASNSVVGACSVVTRRFLDESVAIAGNPAKIVRRNIKWFRNTGPLGSANPYRESFDRYHSQFPRAWE